MESTTIKVGLDTKHQLDQFKEYKRETYDELIRKILYIVEKAKTEPALSQETIMAIENARKRIREENLVTEEEAKKRLGF